MFSTLYFTTNTMVILQNCSMICSNSWFTAKSCGWSDAYFCTLPAGLGALPARFVVFPFSPSHGNCERLSLHSHKHWTKNKKLEIQKNTTELRTNNAATQMQLWSTKTFFGQARVSLWGDHGIILFILNNWKYVCKILGRGCWLINFRQIRLRKNVW